MYSTIIFVLFKTILSPKTQNTNSIDRTELHFDAINMGTSDRHESNMTMEANRINIALGNWISPQKST